MCEKRLRNIKKGSRIDRLREARRHQRIQRMTPAPANQDHRPAQIPQVVNKALQNKVILELAWKTVILMRKNRIIQEKIVALQKETSEFVATIMNNPENRQRYLDNMRLQANVAALALDPTVENKENSPIVIKTEPDA